jgi:ABC-2 type transport system permease protein
MEVEVRAYASLLWFQLRQSITLAMQYRLDFVVDGVVELFWAVTSIVPLFVIYGARDSVAGWSFGEALMVTGFFTLLQAVLEGAINPSLGLVVEQIRRGTFDFVLLKPRDAQFLVSTARVQPWRGINVLTAMALFAFGFRELGRAPAPLDGLAAVTLFVAAVTILYSLWIVSVSIAFWVVKIDNLNFLFGAIFDAARWPSSVFRGVLRAIFTFVIPLAVMTTFPAEALLGRHDPGRLAGGLAAAAIAFALSRAIWRRALGRYTSASS